MPALPGKVTHSAVLPATLEAEVCGQYEQLF